MDFLNKINEYAQEQTFGAVEIPANAQDVVKGTDTLNAKEVSSDTDEKVPSLEEMVKSGNIQMSWTTINTSSHGCGCNNACFNACTNIG